MPPHQTIGDVEMIAATAGFCRLLGGAGLPPRFEPLVAPLVTVAWKVLLTASTGHPLYSDAISAGFVLGLAAAGTLSAAVSASPAVTAIKARIARKAAPAVPIESAPAPVPTVWGQPRDETEPVQG
jgi:hypothetical protein